ncbi:MAG: ABC transporter permease [Acidimicrobiales bacterium]
MSTEPSTVPGGRAITLITRRELQSRLASRAFVAGLASTVVVIFAVFGIGALLSGDDALRVGLVGEQPDGARASLAQVAELTDTDLEVTDYESRTAAEAALDNGDVDGVVVDGTELLMTETDNDVVALVTPVYQQVALVAGLTDAGLAPADVDSALAGAAPLRIVELDADPDRDDAEGVAFISVILLFVAIQIAGAYIMMGVFEEKSTKVVELVLSSVRARDLLIGKIIGVGVLGLVQVVALAGSALIAATVFGTGGVPSIGIGTVVSALMWFVLGYLLYGSVFAAGASLAPRQEDAQSTLGPVSVLLMLAYFGAIFAAADPGSTLARVVSWVPVTAPFAMPGRTASGDALWWEVVGSMALTGVVACAVLLLAERVYVRSIIHTDRKLGWREAWSLQP